MLDDLFPYSEYKDSGLPYFGLIPTHWKVLRNGQIFSQRNQTGFPDLPILEVSLKTGVRVRDFDNSKRKQIMSDRGKYKRAAKGDIAYNMMRMWQGAVGVAPVDGLISPAYVVASPFSGVDSRYYSYLFRTQSYMNEVNKYSHGIVADRNRLYWDEFKQMPSLFPPSDEQKKIADFLDAHGRKVSRLVRIKRRQIELLKELKQSVINDAISRGVNTNIQLKPSGIDGLGEIPEHWELVMCKRILTLLTDYTANGSFGDLAKNVTYLDAGYARAIRLTDLRTNLFNPGVYVSEHAYNYLKKSKLFGGEFLIANVGAHAGYACIMPKVSYPATLAPNMMMAKFRQDRILIDFIVEAVNCNYVQAQLKIKANKSAAQPKINKDDFKQVILAIPSLEEQIQILNYIALKTEKLNRSIVSIENEISLIIEFRSRLIADAVTGRKHIGEIVIGESLSEDSDLDITNDDALIDNEDVADLEECEV
ncbi:hypothetical protein GCM10010916_43480 [Paenibacillus abyssi]|uniref:Type I restriction modification DNA specificity domain-containing protein n=2 Tax=Paenibacillus abyssi TaxID=1340531 RepID=A0A917LGX2_9BACL|nr:hypothetical protein GCM10010916_43480 [Paenibacillus abyssi]